jgi:hypothetical protein
VRRRWVVAGVAEDLESVLDELFAGLDGADGVGQQRLLVAQDLELDPAGAGVAELIEQLATEAGHADGVVRGEAAGGVGQDRVAVGVDEVEQALALLVVESLAPDGDGDNRAAGGVERVLHEVVGLVLAGADEEAAGEGATGDLEGVESGLGGGRCGHVRSP